MEENPLQVWSAGEPGTRDVFHLQFLDSSENDLGGVNIKFDSTPTWWLDSCSSAKTIDPALIPTVSIKDMVWTVILAKPAAGEEGAPRVTLKYYGNEVIDVTLSDTVCDQNADWKDVWETEVVMIKFAYDDSASDNYRPGDFILRLKILEF